jgi:two-component system response regulator DesR
VESLHRRIVLIDDSAVALKALKTVLGLHPEWEIVGEAENGHKGLALFHETNPDVVIVDFQMPGMNGIEVGKEIRGTDPGVLLILFTLHAGAQLESLAKEAGFDAVLSKAAPYPIVAIIEMMKASSTAPPEKATDGDEPEPVHESS